MTDGFDETALLAAVRRLRAEVERAELPLDLGDAADAREARSDLLGQLDDHVIPRLGSPEAPLLVVVGGPTGAGKSTLVNSLVGQQVSPSGVLRPTTRCPVLVHHPGEPHRLAADQAVRSVESAAVPAGLALLDAPDVDSVVGSNRELAHRLMAAADLWLFVTTAARYADAVPWALLCRAAERGASVAVVLDRVPPEAMEEVRGDLAGLLAGRGLAGAPVFTVAETPLAVDGLLPDPEIARLRSWLCALARDRRGRAIAARRTLAGVVASLPGRVAGLSAASAAQADAADTLRKEATSAYAAALTAVERGLSDGSLVRGEVLACWQELIGSPGFGKATVSLAATESLEEAVRAGARALVTARARGAAATAAGRWRQVAGGEALLRGRPDLADASPELPERVDRLVLGWRAEVSALGVDGAGVVAMLAAGTRSGGESGRWSGRGSGRLAEVARGRGPEAAAALAWQLLVGLVGEPAAGELTARARGLLVGAVRRLYAEEQARFDLTLPATGLMNEQSQRLSAAAAAVEAHR